MEETGCISHDDVVVVVVNNDNKDNDDMTKDKSENSNNNDDYQYKYSTSLLLTSLLQKQQKQLQKQQKQQQQQQQQQQQKSNENIIIVATTKKQSTIRMMEYTKYRQRILTFTILKYFGKPIQLSPIICSMLGWSMNIISSSNNINNNDSTTIGSINDTTIDGNNRTNTNTNTNTTIITTQYDNTVQCTSCRAMVALLYLGGGVSTSSTSSTSSLLSCTTILSPNVTNRLIQSYEEQLYYKSHYEFCIYYQPSYNYYISNINLTPTLSTTGTSATTMSTAEEVKDNKEKNQDPISLTRVDDNNNNNNNNNKNNERMSTIQQLKLFNSAISTNVSIIRIPLLLSKILPEYVLELYDTPYDAFIRHCLDMIQYIQKQQQLNDLLFTSLNNTTDVSLVSRLKIPIEITRYHTTTGSKINPTESTSSITKTPPTTLTLSPSLLDILITIVTKHLQILKKEALDSPLLVEISVLLVLMGWYPTYMLRPQEKNIHEEDIDNSTNEPSSNDTSNNTTVECPFCCVQRSISDLIFTKCIDVPTLATTTPIMNKRRRIEIDSITQSNNESTENTTENNDTTVDDDTDNNSISNNTTVPVPVPTDTVIALNNNINVFTGHRYYCPYRCGFVVPSSNCKNRSTNPPLWQLVSDAIITATTTTTTSTTTTTQSENSISNDTVATTITTNSNNNMEQNDIQHHQQQQQQKLTSTNWLINDGNINIQDEYMTDDIKSLKVHQLLRSALSKKTFPSII